MQRSAVDVLVVDDHQLFRAVAKAVVEVLPGWRVVGEAGSGEDAVAQAAALRPAVVLMDVDLPGITGIEATRRIVLHAPAIRVVLLSTYAAEDLPDDAWSCGATCYVRKDHLTPAALGELVAA